MRNMFLGVGIILLLAGVALCVWAWRGRRVDDHPICRRCAYDLLGAAGDCPECGADLAAPRAVRIGNRVRRRSWLIGGLVILLLSVAELGTATYLHFADFNFHTIKPFTWLLADAIKNSGAANDPNMAEIDRRYKAGDLTDGQIHELIDAALAAQVDGQTKLPDRWRVWLHDLFVSQAFTQEQLERYLQQSLTVDVEVRPVLRRGRSTVLRIHEDLSLDLNVPLSGHRRHNAVMIDKTQVLPASDDSFNQWIHLTTHYGIRINTDVGDHTLTTQFTYSFDMGQLPRYQNVTVRVPISIPITVVDQNAQVDSFVADASKRDAMNAAWTATRIETTDGKLHVYLKLERLPVAMAMALWLHQDGESWRVADLVVDTNSRPGWYEVPQRNARLPAAGEVAIELRPDQAAAEYQDELKTYWGEAMRRDNIIVNAPYTPPFNMDATLAPAMEKAISLNNIVVRDGGISLTMTSDHAPTHVDWRVRVRTEDEWVDAPAHQSLRASPSQHESYSTGGLPLPDIDATHADIMLVPNRDWETHIFERPPPWGYPILFEAVPLPRADAGEGPTGRIHGKAIIE